MTLNDTLFSTTLRDGCISDAMSAQKVPGVALAAIKSGKPALEAYYGISDSASNTAVSAGTVFEAASLTKTLFSCLTMRFVQDGLLALDEPLLPRAPHLAPLSADPRLNDITARHVLTHASGLPNWAGKPLGFKFTPGESFSYSGEGFFFLQKVIEHLTGSDMPALFDKHFITPWGMTHSWGMWRPGTNLSRGFDKNGEMHDEKTDFDLAGNAPEPNAAWSLCTTPADYMRYVLRLLGGGAGLSPQSVDMMASKQNTAACNISWGLGWGLVDSAPGVMWHWGDNTGFKSIIALDRVTLDAIAIFTNSDNGARFTLDICRRFTGEKFFDDIGRFIIVAE